MAWISQVPWSQELLPVLPCLSPGDKTLPLAPILFSHGANGLPLEASAPPRLSQGAALSLLAGPRAGDTGRKRSAHSPPSGAPGETLLRGASVIVIGPGKLIYLE